MDELSSAPILPPPSALRVDVAHGFLLRDILHHSIWLLLAPLLFAMYWLATREIFVQLVPVDQTRVRVGLLLSFVGLCLIHGVYSTYVPGEVPSYELTHRRWSILPAVIVFLPALVAFLCLGLGAKPSIVYLFRAGTIFILLAVAQEIVVRPLANRALPRIWIGFLGDHPPFKMRAPLEFLAVLLLAVLVSLWQPQLYPERSFPQFVPPSDTLEIELMVLVFLVGVAVLSYGLLATQTGRLIGLLLSLRRYGDAPRLVEKKIATKGNDGIIEKVIHLSDIHVTRDSSTPLMDGTPSGNERLRKLIRAQMPAFENADIILLTGDITDTGDASEWGTVSELLDSVAPTIRHKLVLVPGNHDLNIAHRTRRLSTLDLDGFGRDLRRLRFLSAVDQVQGARTFCVSDDTTNPTLRPFREVCCQTIPKLGDGLAALLPASGLEGVSLPPRFWNQLEELWTDVFPMYVEIPGSEVRVVVFDSNEPATNVITNAFGRVSPTQRRRLRQLRQLTASAPLVAAVHHHFGRIGDSLRPANRFQRILAQLMDRGLAMMDTQAFLDALETAGITVVFCGHSHFGCVGSIGHTCVVCAPATAIGNESAAGVACGREIGFAVYDVNWNNDGHCGLAAESWMELPSDAA